MGIVHLRGPVKHKIVERNGIEYVCSPAQDERTDNVGDTCFRRDEYDFEIPEESK